MNRGDHNSFAFKAVLAALSFVVAVTFVPLTARSEPSQAPNGGTKASPVRSEAAGVEELIKILVEKGILKQEQVSAMAEKGKESGLSGLSLLMEALKEKGLLSAGDISRVDWAQAAATVAVPQAEPKIVKRIGQAVPDAKKAELDQMKAEIKAEVIKETKSSVPEWVKNISLAGDVRIRYNGDYFDRNNADFVKPSDPTQLLNSKEDRQRGLVRARLGATTNFDDWIRAGLRLSTGSTSNPVTQNQTMGNYFNNYSVVLDRAYLEVKPIPSLSLIGGRFDNPFFHTDMVWDPDVFFDGIAANYRLQLGKRLGLFAVAGFFPLQELEFTQHDKWLYAGQIGMDYTPYKQVSGKIGLAYYDYRNTRGIANSAAQPNEYDYTAPQFQQKGNTLFDIDPTSTQKFALAAEYREIDFTARLDLGFWDPIHVVFTGDYVKNIGFDWNEVKALTGNDAVPKADYGYEVGLSVGYPQMRKFADWRVFGYYRYLGGDAVLDAFTDSDFHLGGTNAKGWILGGEFGLAKNLWTTLRWVTTNEVKGPPFAIDSIFLDVTYRF